MTGDKKPRFQKLVESQIERTPRLPLVHSTDGYRFIHALDDSAVEPSPCNVFNGECLLYLFYGRPAYRVNANLQSSSLEHYLPVCFVFPPSITAQFKRVFPFDSGGFVDGVYEAALHKAMTLADFSLEANPTTPGRLVQLFFGSNEQYMAGTPIPDLKLQPSQMAAQSFYALVSSKLSNAYDDRSSGIEIQIDSPLHLEEAEAAIIPSTFLDDQDISDALARMKVTPIPYSVSARHRPTEYTTSISRLVCEYYREKKYLTRP